ASLTVTTLPDWVQVPLQPLLSCWPPVNENWRVQLVIGAPRLVMVRFGWKPTPQSLATVYCTLQAGPAACAVTGPTPTAPASSAMTHAADESALLCGNLANM